MLLDVASDLTIADLKSLINAELSAQSPNPAAQLSLYHNGKLLGDPTKTITEAGIQDNDLVAAHSHPGPSSRGSRRPAPPQQQAQSSRDPPPGYGGGGRGGEQKEPDTEVIRLQVLGDPRLMEELRINQPELAGAINDPARFSHVFQLMDRQRREAEQQKDREIVSVSLLASRRYLWLGR